MRPPHWPGFVAGALFASLLVPALERSAAQEGGPGDLAAMMEAARRYTQPGEHHALLERFLGDWDTQTTVFMAGEATEPEPGKASFSWKMDGRWLQMEGSGRFFGQELRSYWLMGYDNFKQSYVATAIDTMDTAMRRAEGDLDPSGEALLMYGTIDEYLTGEHDKMVKLVWRFPSEGELVLEIHDLAIGERNTKVVETRYRRRS